MSSYSTAALMGCGKLEKGSTAAKARMAYLRSLRKTAPAGGKRISRRTARGGALGLPTISKLIEKGIGFWGKWGKTNIGDLVNYIKDKKSKDAAIRMIKNMTPETRKKFQEMNRYARGAVKEAERRYNDAVKRKKTAPEAIKKLMEAELAKVSTAADVDYDEHQADNVQQLENTIDDTDDMVSIPPNSVVGGKMSGRDIMDIFLGPYGWAALASRKIQEKKRKKRDKEYETLMYGDDDK